MIRHANRGAFARLEFDKRTIQSTPLDLARAVLGLANDDRLVPVRLPCQLSFPEPCFCFFRLILFGSLMQGQRPSASRYRRCGAAESSVMCVHDPKLGVADWLILILVLILVLFPRLDLQLCLVLKTILVLILIILIHPSGPTYCSRCAC